MVDWWHTSATESFVGFSLLFLSHKQFLKVRHTSSSIKLLKLRCSLSYMNAYHVKRRARTVGRARALCASLGSFFPIRCLADQRRQPKHVSLGPSWDPSLTRCQPSMSGMVPTCCVLFCVLSRGFVPTCCTLLYHGRYCGTETVEMV